MKDINTQKTLETMNNHRAEISRIFIDEAAPAEDFSQMTNEVVVALVLKDPTSLLMLKKPEIDSTTKHQIERGTWEFPQGRVAVCETATSAAQRHVRALTGLRIEKFYEVHQQSRQRNNPLTYTYVMGAWSSGQALSIDLNTFLRHTWKNPGQMPPNMDKEQSRFFKEQKPQHFFPFARRICADLNSESIQGTRSGIVNPDAKLRRGFTPASINTDHRPQPSSNAVRTIEEILAETNTAGIYRNPMRPRQPR